ncbi:unnamed protein product [Pedinophyceae sp. YPF-701]|nr:unnamed protein product [Pedinophyceae sp. YPF-701]
MAAVAEPPAVMEKSTHSSAVEEDGDEPSSLVGGQPIIDHKKYTFFQEAFDLDSTEVFIDDFVCARRKKFLMQGRLYLFNKHVCFYSNVFGANKAKVIPLPDVTAVTKARTVGIPNSLKISVGEKHEFFASFLNRAEAYDKIIEAWMACSGNAKAFLATRESKKHLLAKFEDSDSEEDERSVVWEPIKGPIPPLDAGKESPQLVLETTLTTSASRFFNMLLADDSNFQEAFSSQVLGDWDVTISKWGGEPDIGYVRDFTFMKKIKNAPMGPPKTFCHQTQRLRAYSADGNEAIVLDCSQVMKDIPYGDRFSVCQRWELVEGSGGEASLKVWVWCPFSKGCMFKGVIVKQSTSETRETLESWAKCAAERLDPRNKAQPAMGEMDTMKAAAHNAEEGARRSTGLLTKRLLKFGVAALLVGRGNFKKGLPMAGMFLAGSLVG